MIRRSPEVPALLGVLALVTGCATGSGGGPAAAGQGTARCASSTVVFQAGTDGYTSFRIPAVVNARNTDGRSVLIAFAEGRRHSGADAGDIDVLARRSEDGGCTWSPLQVVTDAGAGTAGNPAPVVDPRTGRVVLVTCRNGGSATEEAIMRGSVPPGDSRRVFVQHSDDAGRTWSSAEEITAQAKREDWRWYATGPGHALVLTHGPHAGRLVVPANHSAAPPVGSGDDGTEPRHYGGHALISDDGGTRWRIGYVHDGRNGQVNVNETSAAQLPDGSVHLNARDQQGTAPGNRAFATSSDGAATLDAPFRPSRGLTAPVVQASVLQTYRDGRPGPLLLSAPAHPDRRLGMTIRASQDGGRSWTPGTRLSDRPAGYSDLVQLDDATVGLLYETGSKTASDTITFVSLPLSEL